MKEKKSLMQRKWVWVLIIVVVFIGYISFKSADAPRQEAKRQEQKQSAIEEKLKEIKADGLIKVPSTHLKTKEQVEEDFKEVGFIPQFVVDDFSGRSMRKDQCDEVYEQDNVKFFGSSEVGDDAGYYAKKGTKVVVRYADKDYEKTDSSSSKEPETTPSSSSEEKASKKVSNNENYESIYNEYVQKIKEATPRLVQEYQIEAQSNQNGLDGLAELSNKKIEDLATILNEGIEKMAEYYFSAGSGKYEEYEDWAGKLTDVYMSEGEQITNAYMESAI